MNHKLKTAIISGAYFRKASPFYFQGRFPIHLSSFGNKRTDMHVVGKGGSKNCEVGKFYVERFFPSSSLYMEDDLPKIAELETSYQLNDFFN